MKRFFFALACLIAANAVLAGDDEEWRKIDSENTVYMELADGLVVIELNPVFAPITVAHFKRLVRDSFYDGKSFYRVIESFVAQGGDGSDMEESNSEPTVEAEFERNWSDSLPYALVQKPDMFASETGFVQGFPVGRDGDSGSIWITHCPGIIAMARQTAANTGSTDFYVVIGQAPRHLDRNLSVFGRVVYGMDVVQKIRRGPAEENGMIANPVDRSEIVSMRIAEDVSPGDRLVVEVVNTGSESFKDELESRRNRTHEFFVHKPPSVLDVCQISTRGRLAVAN